MTEKPEGNGMEPPRMHTEQGQTGRAIVINYTLAWMIFMVAISALITGVVRVTTIDNRVSSLEVQRMAADSRLDSLDGRLRPLEITAASIAFLSAQIADLNRRLDSNQGPHP
jgi:hypothetical protein